MTELQTLDAAALVARDELVARLERSAERKVTVISAPAGSGKTSLLRAWAAGPGRAHRVALVPVGQGERDPQVFWRALLSAVRQACGATRDEPATAASGPSGRSMADRVRSELAGYSGRVVVVIDDAHQLTAPGAMAELVRLLANLPAQAHAIVSTRRNLPLGLHQLRLTGELAEIRAADLQFTVRETGAILAASGIELSECGTALLWQRTEGWAAGLRLAVLSLAGHPDPERFVAEFSGSDRTVAEYLLGEMLERQPPDVQDLLLRTCLLDRVSGELADLLTGRPGADPVLLHLEESNAFVVSLDATRTWFRYHRLFADLLRLQLRRTMPDQVPALHRRAAQWLGEHGQVADAIRHTQAAGDWAAAARLLADHCVSLTLDGHAHTLRALMQAFPPGAGADPELALVRATDQLVLGHPDEAAAYLAVAEVHVETTPPDRRRLRAATASVRQWLTSRKLPGAPPWPGAAAASLARVAGARLDAPAPPADPPAGRLSRSELRVLRYLPTNLSRAEIAADLSVSVNTVSTHIRNIYAKFGTDDRTATVLRARQLRLLGVPPQPIGRDYG